MKTGPTIGCLGCLLLVASLAIRDKRYEVTQAVAGLTAILLLVVATIFVGREKKRPLLGVVLSVLSVVYGLGFFVMLLVPTNGSRLAD